MRKLVDGKDTYRIPEKQYRQLLERFDVSKAKPYETGMVIRERCICSNGFTCKRCCLGKGELRYFDGANCLNIMCHLVGRIPPSLIFSATRITWPQSSKAAPVYVQKVREGLLTLPRTHA